MKTFRQTPSIFTVSEGDTDILFLWNIYDLYTEPDTIFFKPYPRGDMLRGKDQIKKNLSKLRSQFGDDSINSYIGIYDSDSSEEDLTSDEFKLIKVNRCLEYLLLKIIGIDECDTCVNSIDIKKFFNDRFEIYKKGDLSKKDVFNMFLKKEITKERIDSRLEELNDLKEIVNLFIKKNS